MADNKIPIVDMENLYNVPFNREDSRIQKIAEQFGAALHQYGFAYLTNHGIPDDLIVRAFEESKKFFELPQPVKAKYRKVDVVKNYHGYAHPGQELLNADSVHELRETFDIYREDRYYPTEEVPNFQSALESLEQACRAYDVKLLKLLGIAVKLDDEDFFMKAALNLQDRSVPSLNTLRTLYYPPVPENVQAGTVRISTHTDYGIITLLFQDEIGGLEVKRADNKWIQAEPIANTIVVNTGDLLECWTGKYFPATDHRVLIPETEVQRRSKRQSIAFFLQPDDHIIISPLKSEILTEQLDFEPLSALDHAMNQVKKTYGQY